MDDEVSFNDTVGAVLPSNEEKGHFHFFRKTKANKKSTAVDARAPTTNVEIKISKHDPKPRQKFTSAYLSKGRSNKQEGSRPSLRGDSRETYNHSHSMRNISSPRPMMVKGSSNSISMMDLTTGGTVGASLTSQELLCRRKSNSVKSAVKVPSGSITIVVTDVKNSTGLWERDPSAMKKALNLHDAIIRKCYSKHSGYEITTEGDSFQLAFQHPLDALSFCFQAQIDLYDADWADDILSLKDAKLDTEKTFRGLRVRMGLHHGPTTSHIHEITLRTFYKGEALDVAKTVSHAAHGGMILTTLETWRSVSGMAERYLGSPQVIDCGTHILDGERSQSMVQLVAKKQAFDYFYWRGRIREQNRKERKEGRRFSRISSIKQVSTSFFDAPYSGNVVTLVFAFTAYMITDLSDGAKLINTATLAKILRSHLSSSEPPGYECQEDGGNWMLAFHSVSSAVTFGTTLVGSLRDAPINVKVGIHTGSFTSMGPHAVTGRADYFGPVVNRAARIASGAKAGQVVLGILLDDVNAEESIDFDGISGRPLGVRQYKGIEVDIATFSCSKKKK